MVLAPGNRTAVLAEALSLGYEDLGAVFWAVREVDLELPRGGSLCIVGESGSGKTTLGNALAGLIPPYVRTAGRLVVEGVEVVRGSRIAGASKIRGRVVTRIPQNPAASLNPYLRIEEMFYDVLRDSREIKSRGEAREEAVKLLSLVGLDEGVLHMYPHELSGGMSQRVAIALALAPRPSIIVADEPTSNLDAYLRGYIVRLIGNLNRKLGVSLVTITHDISIVEIACEDMAVMFFGEIVERGPVRDVLGKPLHPYTSELIEATTLKRAGLRYGEQTSGCAYYARCPYGDEECLRPPPPARLGGGREVRCWRLAR